MAPQNKMGPQSQRRLTLQERTHHMQASSNNKRKAGQLTLFGIQAFDFNKDCEVCRGRLQGREVHRAHHQLCPNNKCKKGMVLSQSAIDQLKKDQQLKQHFEQPLQPSEKASSRYATKEAGIDLFAAWKPTQKQQDMPPSQRAPNDEGAPNNDNTPAPDAELICTEVTAKVNDPTFQKEHEKNRAPLAMPAFAGVAVEHVINKKRSTEHFDGLTLTVPSTNNMHQSPHCHSIVGQKLLLVDWLRLHDFAIRCPNCHSANLRNDRTNFSKNKVLFPIFTLEGPPSWCVVMSMVCPCCRQRFAGNDGNILSTIPAHAANRYPVEPKHALQNKNTHLGTSATQVFDMLMTTYGNGDLCSRLLYNTLNRSHLERTTSFYSYHASKGQKSLNYVPKDGSFITVFPPLGDWIQETYDDACNNSNNHWGISDHDRHVRELQGVKCNKLCAEDHTHEVTKTYFRRKQIGANALWDVATETGKIVAAALVPSTKTKDLSHAAIALSRRPGFKPKAMHSDRWPVKVDYWSRVFGAALQGRLGLFHYTQRIVKTLRKRHVDYFLAINLLLDSMHFYHQEDYESLLIALKDGTLNGTKHTEEDISNMKSSKTFRQRYGKYLRKEIRLLANQISPFSPSPTLNLIHERDLRRTDIATLTSSLVE